MANTHRNPGKGRRIKRSRMGEVRGRGHGAAPAANGARARADAGEVEGWLSMTPRGFGFVAAADLGPDIFIPPGAFGPALHGDRVVVRARRSAKGREGEVVRVIQRTLTRVTGVFRRVGKREWVELDDARIERPLSLVGPAHPNARDGKVVVVQLTRYPHDRNDGLEGRVVAVLGVPGDVHVAIASLKVREGIQEDFPDDVLREAQDVPSEVSSAEISDRVDLRDVPLVTIDPDDARDHDDAVWAERLPGGDIRALIAVADVSHYVREGTAIDREAHARGVSIYLPDRAIPMLPEALSSEIASLKPEVDRLALVVDVRLTARGKIVSYRVYEAAMRSHARLTYRGAAEAMAATSMPVTPHGALAYRYRELLRVLFDVAASLRAHRRERGTLEFDLPEARVVLDEDTGRVLDIVRSRQDPAVRDAYNTIEELMVLANEIVASDLSARAVAAIYRVHAPPDPERIRLFSELALAYGHTLPEDVGTNAQALSHFLRRVESSAYAQTLHYLLLRAMAQATYDTQNIGHFGLGASHYLHFTSPIRRYPDLAVHRVVRRVARTLPRNELSSATLRGERSSRAEAERERATKGLQESALVSSRLERRAASVEREAIDIYRVALMKERIGQVFDGKVSEVRGDGFYVRLESPFVDVFVPIDCLKDDFYELDEQGLRLIGVDSGRMVRITDYARIRITDASLEQRRITGQLEELRKGEAQDVEVRTREKAAKVAPRGRRDRGSDRQKRRTERVSPGPDWRSRRARRAKK